MHNLTSLFRQFVVAAVLSPLLAVGVQAAVIFDNLSESYGQGGFEQYTAGQQVGASIINGPIGYRVSTVRMGGTLPPVSGAYLSIYGRVTDGSFDDGALGALLYSSSDAPSYVETKPADQFNPARGTTTFDLHSAFTLLPDTGYWFVLVSPTFDPTTGPVQWAYTYSGNFSTDAGSHFPSPGDRVTYFSGVVPDPDPTDPAHYFGIADGPQLLQVTGSPVPEPSSIVLLLTFGLFGIIPAIRRRQRRISHTDRVTSAQSRRAG